MTARITPAVAASRRTWRAFVILKTIFALIATRTDANAVGSASRDFDHHYDWSRSRYEWNRRADFRNNRETLEQLRAKRDYDATHHASRKKIAKDNQAIENLYNDMHDRRGGWRW